MSDRHLTEYAAAPEDDRRADTFEREPATSPRRRSYAFGGALYAWPFHCGVAAYVQEHHPLHPEARIFGTSSGSLAASLLACGVNVREVGIHAALKSTDAHIGRVGPYLRPTTIRESLQLFMDALPPDAHERATDRLVLTLTQVPSMRHRRVTHFRNRQALHEALVGTMSLPGHAVALAYKTDQLQLGWVLDGGLRPTEVVDAREDWDTVRVATFRDNDRVPKTFSAAEIKPRRRVSLRMRFLIGSTSTRMDWFEHGYECAKAHFDLAVT